MEKIMSFVKGLFVKEGGGINWKTLIGIGAGVALGGTNVFGMLGEVEGGFSMVGALVGAGVGLGGSALLDAVMPSAAPEATPDVMPGRQAGRGPAPDMQIQRPMGGPGVPPQPRGR